MPAIIYSTSHGEKYKIDELSQRLLVHLAIRGESELEDTVDIVGAESEQELLTRIDQYLGPDAAGFVHIAAKTETFDGADIYHYGLTESGEDFVHNHLDELAAPADLRQLSRRVSKLEAELLHETAVDELRSEIEDITRNSIEDLRYDLQNRISELENQLDDLESRVE